MKLFIFLLLSVLFFSFISAENYVSEYEIADQLLKHFNNTQSENDKNIYDKIIGALRLPRFVRRNQINSQFSARGLIACAICRSTARDVIFMRKEGASNEVLTKLGTEVCINLQISSKEVCEGIVKFNLPILTYIIDNEPSFNDKTLCGILLQSENKASCPYSDPRFEWEIDIPPKTKQNKKTVTEKGSNSSLKILHITDIHYDPAYEAYGVAQCDAPTCCRKGQKEAKGRRKLHNTDDDYEVSPHEVVFKNNILYLDLDNNFNIYYNRNEDNNSTNSTSKAGYWGDYRSCDTPWWAFTDAIDHIKNTHKNIDYIYYTGDTIDHGVWETSKEMITTSINDTVNYIKSAFGNIPVYSVIGNHESQPLNQYADPIVTDSNYSTSWLYDLLAEKWSVWLPEDTKETIKIGGYYTVLIKPGFRVVALNNNYCYTYNWWIHLTPNDPGNQLKWLVKVLSDAEKNNEKVHILTHIPAGTTECYYTYNREYRKIIERFGDTITAEFNGHTHNDEFKVFYNNKGLPYLVGWNGGSLTSYSNLNLNYKIFEVEENSTELLNQETWVYNLTEANLHPDKAPVWYKEYDFKEYYNVSSLAPNEIDNLIYRMVTTEKNLLKKDYHIFRGKSSDPFVNKACDENCIEKNLCYMTTSELYDNTMCQRYRDLYFKD